MQLPEVPHEKMNGHDDSEYFGSMPPPLFLESYRKSVKEFVADHVQAGRKVVLVTSGGTTVPLENQTVRFIDNFSAGTRGATSAEYFLDAGYAVIFLHRQFSLLPYSRHYSHSTNCFLDFMTEGADGKVTVGQEYQNKMLDVLRKYHAARQGNRLLPLYFTSVSEYLWELRDIALIMRPLGPNALFYLAAAVSDFFLPKDRMSEHKIQSSDIQKQQKSTFVEADHHHDPSTATATTMTKESNHAVSQNLSIDLDPVPKFLKTLVDGWAPEGMIVSFKLETDPSLLIMKSQQALRKYAHHLVIGNLLVSRKYEVVFVTLPRPEQGDNGERWIRVPLHRRIPSRSNPVALLQQLRDLRARGMGSELEIDNGQPGVEIESLIVPEVARIHDAFALRAHEHREEDDQDLLAKALAWADNDEESVV